MPTDENEPLLLGTVAQSPDDQARVAAAFEPTAPVLALAIPGYEVLRQIGEGGMGTVYLALDLKLKREVALKTLRATETRPEFVARFWAEAEVMAAVRHPHVVQVFELGKDVARPFMAMEYLRGGSLADRLRGEKKEKQRVRTVIPSDEAAVLLEKIARGVAAAHELGIVHRDMKPGNVLLDEDGEPKVTDFGLAKRLSNDLTRTQALMGTPPYMAPEQAAGRAKFVGPQADVWALGVILYECVAGVRPFDGDTEDEILSQITSAEPTALRIRVRGLPRDLDIIVAKCLTKEPAHRYATAGELADDLARFVNGAPIAARPVGNVTRTVRWARRNPVVAGLMSTVVLVLSCLVVSLFALYQKVSAQAAAERSAKDVIEKAAEDRARADNAVIRAALADTEAATKMADRLNDLFHSSDSLANIFGDDIPLLGTTIAVGQATELGPFLRHAAKRFRTTLTNPADALLRAKLLATIGNGMRNFGMFAEARDVLDEVLALRRANLAEAHPEIWQSEIDLGRLEYETGDLVKGIDRFRKLLADQQRHNADEGVTLTTRFYLGLALSSVVLPEAESLLKEVVADRMRMHGPTHKDTLLAKLALLTWFMEKGQWDEILKLVVALKQDVEDQPNLLVRSVLRAILEFQTKLAKARIATTIIPRLADELVIGMKAEITHLEGLVGRDHVLLLVMRFETAQFMLVAKKEVEADELFKGVVDSARRTVGLGHPKVLNLLQAYVSRLADTNDFGGARALFEEVEAANRKQFGAENPWLMNIMLQRAMFEYERGDYPKALACAKEAQSLVVRGKALGNLGTLMVLMEAAIMLGTNKDPECRKLAPELFAALHSLTEVTHGPKSEQMATVLTEQGGALYEMGDRAGARTALDKARNIIPTHAKLPRDVALYAHFFSGRLAMDGGRFADAESCFRDALRSGPNDNTRRWIAPWLAWSVSAQGRYKDAVPLFEEVRRLDRTATPELVVSNVVRAEMHVAIAQFAAGQLGDYRKTVHDRMFERYRKSADGATLAWLVWAGCLDGKPEGQDVAELDAALVASFPKSTWVARSLALLRVRAGKFDLAETALKASRGAGVTDHVIRGLAAVARKDRDAARDHLAKAESLLEAAKPSDKNPFAYASRDWNEFFMVATLLTELRAAVPPPAAAPPPRPVAP